MDSVIENRLRERRQAQGLSQKQLAERAGITRQSVSALEANQYAPATSVALQLARALSCRVEDLFRLKSGGEIIQGELLGELPKSNLPARAQVAQVRQRLLVRSLDGAGELTSLGTSADALIVAVQSKTRVTVKLLKERDVLRRNIVVGGCDPAIFVAGIHLSRGGNENLVPCLMGSGMALSALKSGEIHVAGIHLAEERSGSWSLPDLKGHLGKLDCLVVTFAYWEEGWIVRHGNPKEIHTVTDLVKPTVTIVNRERGSGARRLLDRQLDACGIKPNLVTGYADEALSHLEVAARVKAGMADTGIGVRAAAAICGLDFVPVQRERYDLVIPKAYYDTLEGLKALLDTIASRRFRDELEALGGYDTRDCGKISEPAKR